MSQKDQLFRHVIKGQSCWTWIGSKLSGGYGRITVGGHKMMAHRYSYELHTGAIPPGKIVRHTCDNNSCVNPNHLTLGTHLENAEDRSLRGRNNAITGDRHWTRKHPEWKRTGNKNKKPVTRGKLTAKQVVTIRSAFATGHFTKSAIAREHDVTLWAVRDVLNGRTWSHVR